MKRKILFNLPVVSSMLFGVLLIQPPSSVYAQQPTPNLVWNVTYDGGGNDRASYIITDPLGNTYTTGYSNNGSNDDFRTVKYNSAGTILWNVTYDDGGDEYPSKVAVDSSGNVYVSGASYKGSANTLLLIKYNSAGVAQWHVSYESGGDDMVSGAVPDDSGNIYAAGTQAWGNRYLIKYDSAGNIVWTKIDTSTGCNRNGDIVRDAQGYLYITGYSCDAFRTTKYDSNGNVVWNRIYNPGAYDYANDIAVNSAGDVYVGGWSGNNSSYFEAVTLKYDNAGNLVWDRRYNAGSYAQPGGLATDNLGNVYIGASKRNSVQGADLDLRVIKYDAAGTLEWDLPYDSPGDEEIGGVAADANGINVYVTGHSFNGANYDLRTIKYSTAPATTSLVATTDNNSEIYPGDSVSVDLDIHDANNVFAGQADCTVDAAVIQPQDATFGDFFDLVNRLIGANNADAAAGTWMGAISQRSPALSLSGDGSFATVDYLAQAPGTRSIDCIPLISDQDGFSLPVTYSGTSVTVLPFATANGAAQYQGRLEHSDITVTASGPITRTASTDSDGNFVFNLKTGSYTITASAAGYLSNTTTISATSGQTVTLVGTTLKGGSANGDNVIDIGDATLVAANFGLNAPPADSRADINGDGKVNVQDLAILGGNYGLSGDQPW